jgi:hypothetical protein
MLWEKGLIRNAFAGTFLLALGILGKQAEFTPISKRAAI